MQTFLLSVGFGLVTAAILALSAVAFTLEYAVSRVANLAHGELLTVGAYAAYVVQEHSSDVALAAIAAAAAGGLAALVVAGLLYLLLQRTKFGKAIRAVAENRDLARASGIRARRVISQTWALAGVVAGFSGFVLAETVGTFSPTFGYSFLLITITAAVAGGLGRPYATLVGALVVGLVLELAGAYSNASYELAFAFGMLVLMLLFRPNGLFSPGRRMALR